jgi:hypothetical protein
VIAKQHCKGRSPDHARGGVIALMDMHIVVASAAVGSYLHFLPVRPADSRIRANTKVEADRSATRTQLLDTELLEE